MRDADGLPADVREALTTAIDDARSAIRSGDTETARERVDAATRIVRHKVPPGPVQERLEHGFAAVERTVADEPVVASEYLRLLTQLLEESDGP